jgi:hypothetical protein
MQDTIGQITDTSLIMSETQNTFEFAQDEPCQLMTLTNWLIQQGGEVDASTCAQGNLNEDFPTGVLGNLTDIINNAGNAATVAADVTNINNFRCCEYTPT